MKILYVGPVLPGSTALQRLEAMRELGHSVVTVPSTDLSSYRTLGQRIALKLGSALDLDDANAAVCRALLRERPDICWFDKPITIAPATLAFIARHSPATRRVGYSPDDMLICPNRTRRFQQSLPLLQIFFTTKAHNLTALHRLGAERVEWVGNAYSETIHRPMPRDAEQRRALGGAIGFIGDYEQDRMRLIESLARNGLSVRIWGPNWATHWRRPPANVRIEGRSLVGDEYAQAISNFDINLAFLRKAAHDEITTRSMEIPACGGFMLAERTPAHLEAFDEGQDAEFFADAAELLHKCRHYLAHPEQAQQIAAQGRARCLRDGYGNRARMRHMLALVENSTPVDTSP